MNQSVLWLLVRKDLYLLRALSVAQLISCLLAAALMFFGRIGFAVGGVLYLTANLAGGLMIAMTSIIGERKEQARLFALSLPISGQRYDLVKLLSAILAFGIPWAISAVIVVILGILWPGLTHDSNVYVLLIEGSFLATFSVYLGTLFVFPTEQAGGLAILVVNMMFTLFMVALNQPSVIGPLHDPHITWTPFAAWAFTVQALMVIGSMSAAVITIFRKRDHL